MKFLTLTEAAQLIAKLTGKPVIKVGFDWNDDINETIKAAPYLDFTKENAPDNLAQFFYDGKGIIVCEDESEQIELFDITVGDDGPTKFNSYHGEATVHAVTINKNGELENENT